MPGPGAEGEQECKRPGSEEVLLSSAQPCSALLSPALRPAVCQAGSAPGLWMFPDFG